MHYHSQNLSDGRVSKFWNGRAWLHLGEPYKSRTVHWEWGFGSCASGFSATITWGSGDSDNGILFHLCIPWLFFVFVGIDGVLRCKECQSGIKIHDNSLWIHFLAYTMDWQRDYPWYRKAASWAFPWSFDWWSTEILGHERFGPSMTVVWREDRKHRKPFLETYDERKQLEQSVSVEYPYAYMLKNREVQKRKATVFVERREWRARWWPIIPRRKTSTCINVEFDQEVGEETGTWKGGCTACSYEMKWGETPERCLSRMEHEREFRR